MTPAQLSDAVLDTVRSVVGSGELSAPVPERAGLRRPPHGTAHWATGIALALAGPAGRPAREIAGLLRQRLAGTPGVRAVEVAGPGFLNITLGEAGAAEVLREVLSEPAPAPLPEDPARDADLWAAAAGGDRPALLVQREDNPLFRVRHAHAHVRRLARGAASLGIAAGPAGGRWHPAELRVVPLLAERQRFAAAGAGKLARHLVAVADTWSEAATAVPVLPVGDEKPGAVHRSRLALALAAGRVLAGGLHQLGISAPEHL
ncbi:hypothetical protein GCM10009716_07640 [Streptomyces sodiiphilus]|uniref:Arginine--tRNA ligase n=1 Tax=Streptomyces sodiiphilus TaxID=226217 RepID=A0ABN2NSW0_9ACTN